MSAGQPPVVTSTLANHCRLGSVTDTMTILSLVSNTADICFQDELENS